MAILKTRMTSTPPAGASGVTVVGTTLSNQQVDENFLSLNERKLSTAGGTMTGFIVLHSDPSTAMQAATKQSSESAAAAAVATHTADTTDAHAASAITNTPAGGVGSTNVQAAINELDTEKLALSGGTMTGLLTLSGAPTADLHASTKKYVDDHVPAMVASGVTVTPAGSISAVNVQTALEELDNEKEPVIGYTPVNVNGDTMLGMLTAYDMPTDLGHFSTKAYSELAALWFGGGNILVNGNFTIWQRGTSFTGIGTTRERTADCWWVRRVTGAGTVSVSRVSQAGSGFNGYGSGKYALKMQRPAGDVNLGTLRMAQSLETEASEAFSVQASVLTLSVRLKKGANYSGGDITVYVRYGTGTDQNVLDSYTGEGTLLTWTITPSTDFETYTNNFSVNSSINELGVMIQYTPTGTAGADDSISVSDVMLTRAIFNVATNSPVVPFQYRPFAEELMRCMRYYETSFPYGTKPAQNTGQYMPLGVYYSGSTSAVNMPVMLKVPKRGTSNVTLTTFNPGAANAQVRNITDNQNGSSTSASFVGAATGFFMLSYNQGASSNPGDVMGVGWEISDDNF